jgi:hypothetical protein
MSITKTLTGRRRFRVQPIGIRRRRCVLVLEVEERHEGYFISMSGPFADRIPVDKRVWRDATLADLTLEELRDERAG